MGSRPPLFPPRRGGWGERGPVASGSPRLSKVIEEALHVRTGAAAEAWGLRANSGRGSQPMHPGMFVSHCVVA